MAGRRRLVMVVVVDVRAGSARAAFGDEVDQLLERDRAASSSAEHAGKLEHRQVCSLATEQVFREADKDIDSVAPVPGGAP